MDPVSMASLGLTAASTVIGAAGAQAEGSAAKQMAWYKAAVSKQNAETAKRNAENALAAGEARASMERLQTAGLVGKQRAAQAASGLDVNVGSLVDLRSSTAMLGELDARVLAYNAAREAFGYRTQAHGFETQSQLDIIGGKNAQAAADWKTASTIIGGASSFADKWMGFKRAGIQGY